MSMTSKVSPILRANIIKSLNIVPGKTNSSLHASGIANPSGTFSKRAIQEATQKLTREGVIVAKRDFGRTLFYNAPVSTTPLASAATV